ncbi:MAG: FN3 associated domain-containing protein [Verrucomicrobiales bacterium]
MTGDSPASSGPAFVCLSPIRSGRLRRRLSLGVLAAAGVLVACWPAAATPVISEFLASNRTGVPDADGDHPDWIEIYNPGPAAADLGGFYLTDNAGRLTKWRLPAVTLNAGGYLVVFASGKDRAVAGAELHANFSLSADGEYLALVSPDGVTILSEYAPVFPRQFADVSYGRGVSAGVITTATPIVTGHPVRYLVPKLAEPAGDWRSAGFDDSGWGQATTALGFGYAELPIGQNGDLTEAMRLAAHGSVYVRVPFEIALPAEVIGMTLRMKCDDGFVAWLNGHPVASSNAPSPVTHTSLATESAEVEPGDPFIDHSLAFSGHLVQGTNILAFQGLNLTHTGSDFLLLPELDLRRQDLSTGLVNGYFDVPTPGTPNSQAVPGYIADTQFSVRRGFFTAPFPLQITSETPNVEIRYTTDGTAPTESHGSVYTGPITIDRTTTLRAAAFRSGLRPTNVDTQTYVFLADVEKQPVRSVSYWDVGMDPNVVNKPGIFTVAQALADVPTLSIVMEPRDLFGSTTGIYANATREASVNPIWEKRCSAEYFYHPDYRGPYRVADGFQIECGIVISGNFSRLSHNPKHSFRIKFKREYGASKLEFPIFPTSSIDEYDTLVIRTGHNQGWATNIPHTDMLRDQHSRDIQGFDPRQAVSDGNHVHLYLNGQYWGLYFLTERPDDAWGAEHYGGRKEDYDSFKGLSAGGSTRAEIVSGDRTAWAAMYALAAQDLTNPVKYQALLAYLDLDQLIDFNIGVLYQGDLDGPTGWLNGPPNSLEPKNFYAMRRRHADGRFRFFRWDAEFIFGAVSDDVSERSGTENPAYLHNRMRRNPDYRRYFGDRVHKYFFNDGAYTPAQMKQFYLDRAAQIDKAVVAESARWGDAKREPPFTRDVHWVNERNRITNSWMSGRHTVIMNQFRADGLYPAVVAPALQVDGAPRHGGAIASTSRVSLTAPVGAIHFTTDGRDPRAQDGSPAGPSYATPLALATTTTIKARVLNGGNWSALTEALFLVDSRPASSANLVIAEIDYEPGAPTDAEEADGYDQRKDFEFVELLAVGDHTVDLSGVGLAGGIVFDFDTRSTRRHLEVGERLVVAKNREALLFRYPAMDPDRVVGEFSQRLGDEGDTVMVVTGNGSTMARVAYERRSPWPTAAAGTGRSLVLNNPASTPDPANPSSWRASAGFPTPATGEGEGSSFASWMAVRGQSDPLAVPPGQSMNNLLVYAFGLDLYSDVHALPTTAIAPFTVDGTTADYLVMTWARRIDAPDIVMAPEISDALGAWTPLPESELVVLSRQSPVPGVEIIQARHGQPALPQRYLRWRAAVR